MTQPAIFERPTPRICEHGFLPGECLTGGDCPNRFSTLVLVEPPEKPKSFCKWCAEELTRKPGEKTNTYNRRRFCDRSCAMKHRIHSKPKRFCEWCSAELFRNAKEPVKVFDQRTHCGKSCAISHRRNESRATPKRYTCKGCSVPLNASRVRHNEDFCGVDCQRKAEG